jgi:hypothetical protein
LRKTYGEKITAGRDTKNAGRGRWYFLKFSRRMDAGRINAGRIARAAGSGQRAAGSGHKNTDSGMEPENRRNPPKIRDPRFAATGLPSGGKGHVSDK